MNFQLVPFNCGHTSHTYNYHGLFSFDPSDQILIDAIKIGLCRATKVNPKAPDGRIRGMDELESVNIRGALTELCTEYVLTNEIHQRNIPNAKITRSDEMEDSYEGINQIDLTLTIGDKVYEIETRSSCVKNGIDFGIKFGYFNLIGWYRTSSKPREAKKDFYFMYLFGFDAPETKSRLKNKIEVSFVGSATKSMLQGSLGSDQTMKQTGALYRGINPICATLDFKHTMDEVFR
ncbi:MAG: hypothetical protein QXN55_02110 [Candidatus Nitrosotenuis sp.]